jgi:bifunctional UDP-N-acetylglucosamine pyrophosphorylase / glucosamine-1-phosphate N-acetyltransferase
MADQLTALVMAAGRGTRMRSILPKVLHPVCGKPMVEWVIDTARDAGATRVLVVTRPGDGVADGLPAGVEVVEQVEGEGTGSAVLAARDQLAGGGAVAILSADHPLMPVDDLRGLREAHSRDGAAATILTTDRIDPTGYGRIVRDGDGSVTGIVETKHAEDRTPEELAIREINLGTYVFDADDLFSALDEVGLQHGERFLTETIPLLQRRGRAIATHLTDDTRAAAGVNDRAQLMEVEAVARRRLIEQLVATGVTFAAPEATVVDAGVEVGPDTVIGLGVTLTGATKVGEGSRIGPHTTLIDTTVGSGATLIATYAVEAEVQDGATIGPFAYLRPGTVVREGAKVGTYVEVKNSDIGPGAKVPHLSYIGDADVGERANLGASTITANYDGRRKHRTKLGKNVKTGIHTSLIAPVDVGDRAYTGAGSVITGDVPDGALGIARAKQSNIEGYADRMEGDSE